MVLGFIRHILSYWDIPVAPAAPAHGPSVAKPSGILVPLYNENNVRIGFVQTTSGASEAIAPEPTKVAASAVIKAERMTGPVIIPSLTPSQVAQAPPKSIFDPATWLPGIAANAPPSKTIWDGWPNGELDFDLTQTEYDQTGKFSTHWACSSHGVGGSIEAETWEKDCAIIIRPKTTRAALKLQLDEQCDCRASLYHTACGLKGKVYTWSRGYHYTHDGFHLHAKVPKVLHLLPHEREEFQQLSGANPTLGAAALVTGGWGPFARKPVSQISPALGNQDCARAEKKKVARITKAALGDGFLEQFAKFREECPDFVIHASMDPVNIICVVFANATLGDIDHDSSDPKDHRRCPTDPEPTDGQVTDGAHRYFKGQNDILITTSIYVVKLRAWKPVIMTYSDGQSIEHYWVHWLMLFKGIVREALDREMEIQDSLFANVVDYSQAQREAFILSFIDVWLEIQEEYKVPNPCTKDQLRAAAEKLLKGCKYHFRGSTVHVSNISAVVPADRQHSFCHDAFSLIDIESPAILTEAVAELLRDYPLCAN
ncbi:hypothetical protein C8J56DRAFT_1056441 [Mycena floridula]|nr:hypothetical protein C8J56DRAFT_1056441 [Mycena floridula]